MTNRRKNYDRRVNRNDIRRLAIYERRVANRRVRLAKAKRDMSIARLGLLTSLICVVIAWVLFVIEVQ